MTIPRVSIIITVFQRTRYLSTAINSVLKQSFDDFEIIVVDDSCSNEISKIVLGFNNKNIRYEPSITRLGVAGAVSSGINRAHGEFIIILNDDDFWSPSLLSELVTPLQKDSSLVMAFCDHFVVDENGRVDPAASATYSAISKRHSLKNGILRHKLESLVLDKAVPMAIGTVFRKEAINAASINGPAGGAYDYWMSCLLAATGGKAYYCNKKLSYYREHSQMETRRRSITKHEDELFILKHVLGDVAFISISRGVKKRLALISGLAAENKLYFGDAASARKHAMNGIRWTVNLRCLRALGLTYFPQPILKRFLVV